MNIHLGLAAAAGFTVLALTPATAVALDPDQGGCDPATGVDEVGSPCGDAAERIEQGEDPNAVGCDYGDQNACDALGAQPPAPEAQPAPEPEPAPLPAPAYDPPDPDAEPIGGSAWWHENARVIVCGSTTIAP